MPTLDTTHRRDAAEAFIHDDDVRGKVRRLRWLVVVVVVVPLLLLLRSGTIVGRDLPILPPSLRRTVVAFVVVVISFRRAQE